MGVCVLPGLSSVLYPTVPYPTRHHSTILCPTENIGKREIRKRGYKESEVYPPKVLPGGDIINKIKEEMCADPEWRMQFQFAIKPTAEEEKQMTRDQARTAYKVGVVNFKAEDFILPEDYPEPPEPSAQDLSRFAKISFEPMPERARIEWQATQIADPIWRDWKLVKGRWRPQDAMSQALELDAKRSDAADTQLQEQLDRNTLKIAEEGAATLMPLQKVLNEQATQVAMEAMTEAMRDRIVRRIRQGITRGVIRGNIVEREIKIRGQQHKESESNNNNPNLEGIQPKQKSKGDGAGADTQGGRRGCQAGHHSNATNNRHGRRPRRPGGDLPLHSGRGDDMPRGDAPAHGERGTQKEDGKARRKVHHECERGERPHEDQVRIRRRAVLPHEAPRRLQACGRDRDWSHQSQGSREGQGCKAGRRTERGVTYKEVADGSRRVKGEKLRIEITMTLTLTIILKEVSKRREEKVGGITKVIRKIQVRRTKQTKKRAHTKWEGKGKVQEEERIGTNAEPYRNKHTDKKKQAGDRGRKGRRVAKGKHRGVEDNKTYKQ